MVWWKAVPGSPVERAKGAVDGIDGIRTKGAMG